VLKEELQKNKEIVIEK